MSLDDLEGLEWDFRRVEHDLFRRSVLSVPAPENTRGEVLVASAYRSLVLGCHENDVPLGAANDLAESLGRLHENLDEGFWSDLWDDSEGLGSPRLGGQRGGDVPLELFPFVPELARYSGVMGREGRRWNPSNLLRATVQAGSLNKKASVVLATLQGALRVTSDDDVLARFLEEKIAGLTERDREPSLTSVPGPGREEIRRHRSPPEQFCRDIGFISDLKVRQTRKQWVVMVESLLRLGLTTYFLWICRLNERLWNVVRDIVDPRDAPVVPTLQQLEEDCWEGHFEEPLVELGADSIPAIKRWLRGYYEARMGFSSVLHVLEEIDHLPEVPLGRMGDDYGSNSPASIHEFLVSLEGCASQLRETIDGRWPGRGLRQIVGTLADSVPGLLSAQKSASRQAYFFLRYTMGQLQPYQEKMRAYDQSYFTYKQDRRTSSPWPVRPGPAMLLMMVHCACRSEGLNLISLDRFRTYLGEYGIHAPAGELIGGKTGKDLERLGLAVESADAGGGRILTDPFPPPSSGVTT